MTAPSTGTYLGDGLYARFDGFHIELSANGHDRAHGATDIVYLEPAVMASLLEWIKGGYRDYQTGERFKT